MYDCRCLEVGMENCRAQVHNQKHEDDEEKPKTFFRPFDVMIPCIVFAEKFTGEVAHSARPEQLRLEVWAFDRQGALERLRERLNQLLDLGPLP